jgi:hypothetical protein
MFTVASRFNKSTNLFRVAQSVRWSTENTAKDASPATGQVSFTLATPNFTFLRDVDVDTITLPGLGMFLSLNVSVHFRCFAFCNILFIWFCNFIRLVRFSLFRILVGLSSFF